jgi:hypothetical protein
MSDGYKTNNDVAGLYGLIHPGYWAHARRYLISVNSSAHSATAAMSGA